MNFFKLKSSLLISKTKITHVSKANQSQLAGFLKFVFASTVFNSLKIYSLIKNQIEGYIKIKCKI